MYVGVGEEGEEGGSCDIEVDIDIDIKIDVQNGIHVCVEIPLSPSPKKKKEKKKACNFITMNISEVAKSSLVMIWRYRRYVCRLI